MLEIKFHTLKHTMSEKRVRNMRIFSIRKIIAALFLVIFSTNVFAAGLIYFVQPDQIGAPRVITDSSKQVVWQIDGAPFGDNETIVSSILFPMRFPGQYSDQEAGFNYNIFRDYDPSSGRYIQSDPIGIAGGLNTYTYARSEPIGSYDFLGLQPPSDNPGFDITLGVVQQAEQMSNPIQFYNKVNNGADWDFKKNAPPGHNWQNYGNYAYGASGAASGLFTVETLAREAGKNQCRSGNSDPKWGTPAGGPPYGDDEEDQHWINEGIKDYNSGMYGAPKAPSAFWLLTTSIYSIRDANKNFSTPNPSWYRHNPNYQGKP